MFNGHSSLQSLISLFLAGGWIFLITLGRTTRGAETSTPAKAVGHFPSTNIPFRQVGPDLFSLGAVQLNKRTRTISFPAQINMREGNIEYLVVTGTGKTHESLLRTDAEPIHVQLAFLLLGARGTTNTLPADPTGRLSGEDVRIELSWKGDQGEVRFPATQFIRDKAGHPMSPGFWTYTGSRLREDGFAAQLDGSIVSLITDPDALINNPRPGREDDDNWLVTTNNLPSLNWPLNVTLMIGPSKTVR